jgi:hypothetical protein
LKQERAWLKEHAHEHPGCWMAVYGDQLIAASPRLQEVLTAARAAGKGDDPILFFQPEG